MSDLKDQILDLYKTPRLSVLATITTDGIPWARYVIVEASDDMTFRCSTFMSGRKVAQLEKNPAAHLTCGIGQNTDMGPYLQIKGTAKVETDPEAKQAFWSDRLSLVFKGPDDPNYGVVTLTADTIEVCHVGQPAKVWNRG